MTPEKIFLKLKSGSQKRIQTSSQANSKRDPQSRDEARERLLKSALAASLLIHGSMVATLAVLQMTSDDDPAPKEDLVWVENSEQKQIVFTNKGKKVDEAKDDAYLSKDNRVVEEQTRAKESNTVTSTAGRKPSPAKQPQARPDQPQAKPLGRLAKFGLSLPQRAPQQQPPKVSETLDQPQQEDYSETYGKRYEDYVSGLKEGETTALNTKEFVFFSYYERIRKQLDQAWPRLLQQKVRRLWRMGGRLPASVKEHKTQTVLELDREGEVVRVSIILASGTRELDDAAVEAFNEAGPFPNPPTSLIDDNGRISISWTFVLTM